MVAVEVVVVVVVVGYQVKCVRWSQTNDLQCYTSSTVQYCYTSSILIL